MAALFFLITFLIIFLSILIAYLALKPRVYPAAPNSTPISSSKLKSLLLKLNSKNPFKVLESKDYDLDIVWDIIDAKWLDVLGKSYNKTKYQAHILLHEKTKTLLFYQILKEFETSKITFKASYESKNTKGLLINTRKKGFRYGIKTDGSIAEIYNYDFNPSDISQIIRQIANDNGWNFKLTIFKNSLKK